MAKHRDPASDAAARAEEPPGSIKDSTKGSINLRIEGRTRRLIDDAAAVLGKTRTEFMIDSARTRAVDVLLDQRLFVADGAAFDAFAEALDAPPEPGPRLRALMRRPSVWKT